MSARSARRTPDDNNAPHPQSAHPGAGDEGPPLTIHQPGSFPASGRNVAFSLAEGDTITGMFRAELSWDAIASPPDIVIHLSAFLLNEESTVPVGNPYYCVHHDNDRSKDGSTVRKGRRQHGHSVRNESVTADLTIVDEDVSRIVLVAYIQDATPLKHSFHGLVGGTVALQEITTDPIRGTEVIRQLENHLLDGDYYEGETAVLVGELIRRSSGTWGYRDIGQGRSGLVEVGGNFGVTFVAG
jgi:stress response protein SCP2